METFKQVKPLHQVLGHCWCPESIGNKNAIPVQGYGHHYLVACQCFSTKLFNSFFGVLPSDLVQSGELTGDAASMTRGQALARTVKLRVQSQRGFARLCP